MKTNELRLGNLVMYRNQIVKTTGLHYDMFECRGIDDAWMCTGKLENIQPIELTEDVLLKIGFKKEQKLISDLYYLDYEKDDDNIIRVKYVIFGSKALPLLKITTSKYTEFEGFEFTKRGVRYLHELQNAYFLMSNQEMEVKL